MRSSNSTTLEVFATVRECQYDNKGHIKFIVVQYYDNNNNLVINSFSPSMFQEKDGVITAKFNFEGNSYILKIDIKHFRSIVPRSLPR